MLSRLWRFRALCLASALLAASSIVVAAPGADAGAAHLDGGVDAGATLADPRTTNIEALLAGALPTAVEPQSLFDVPLDDEAAIQVEAVRLRRLLASEQDAGAIPPTSAAKRTSTTTPQALTDAGSVADPELVKSRDALDRARLDFYALPRERRSELLAKQEARQQAERPEESEAERRTREADAERQKALEAAREARSEAERTVAKELARLIGVEHQLSQFEERLTSEAASLATRRETLIGWGQRVREAKSGSDAEADATYDAVRKTLRAARDELDQVLVATDSGDSGVPELGPDALKDVPPDVPTAQVRRRREALERALDDARKRERIVRHDRAAALLQEVDELNRDRLDLLGSLSSNKRDAVTGFSSAGLEQARSEVRQLLLILVYHEHVATAWLRDLRRPSGLEGLSWWRSLGIGVPWLGLALAFLWCRRRTPGLLALAERRLAESDRAERLPSPSPIRQAIRMLRGVHRSLEWLGFLALTVWLLPARAEAVLEVQLLMVVTAYSFGGALVVNAINSIALLRDASGRHAASDFARLRLRSLQLVGRVVVVFALVLVLSARLVGHGTLYSWVWSTCWFAAVPVFLILVRWWRDTVFSRVDRARRKSAVQRWILANRSGWKSFFAAMIGAVQLFSLGGYKVVRNWVTRFDLVRRAHAYLFKRELSRLASGKSEAELRGLRSAAFASLSPERLGSRWIDSPADEVCRALAARSATEPGGLVALVGPRGQGKTALLQRLAKESPAVVLSCHASWSMEDFVRALEEAGATANASAAPRTVLLDDAQALIKPIRGGLEIFDAVLTYARERCQDERWVFTIDASLWPFLRRARDSRPLFDQVLELEPWADEQIGALLVARDDEAGIDPTFEDLLEKSSAPADDIERQEAIETKRGGYFRVVWDYARGNPGLALEVWRASLAEDSSGAVRVRPLLTPDLTALEALSDSALFVVRAVLQMAPASVADVAQATRTTEAEVESAFRYGRSQGYLFEVGGRVCVAWRWLRPVTALLERRHLLVNP